MKTDLTVLGWLVMVKRGRRQRSFSSTQLQYTLKNNNKKRKNPEPFYIKWCFTKLISHHMISHTHYYNATLLFSHYLKCHNLQHLNTNQTDHSLSMGPFCSLYHTIQKGRSAYSHHVRFSLNEKTAFCFIPCTIFSWEILSQTSALINQNKCFLSESNMHIFLRSPNNWNLSVLFLFSVK